MCQANCLTRLSLHVIRITFDKGQYEQLWSTPVGYKSPLYEMTQTTATALWNDSATLSELTYSIEHGAVGATCNPVIVLEALKREPHPLE